MIIRQEQNILNATLSSSTSTSVAANGRIFLDTAQFNGATYYFEILAINNDSSAKTVRLRIPGGTEQVQISVPSGTSTFTLFRSSSFTPSGSSNNLTVEILNTTTSAGQVQVKAGRVIIIQNDSVITNTETQIEIGNEETKSSASIIPNAAPKYWTYNSANWDGTKTFYAEVVYTRSSTMSSTSWYLQEDNGSFANWGTGGNQQITIVSASTATTITRTRVSFTPVDGRHYRIASVDSDTMNPSHFNYNGKIVIDQASFQESQSNTASANDVQGGTGTSSETAQAVGQSFTTTGAYSLAAIRLLPVTVNSPTDNLIVTVYSNSINGTLIGTSDSIAAANIQGVWTNFNFASPVSLSASTKYYFQVNRSGARDTNARFWVKGSTTDLYAGDGQFTRDNNTWSAESGSTDLGFYTIASTGLTKLEPQYLLANTSLAAGTGLQNFRTKWDSTEWSGVTNSYIHQVDCASTTSTIVLQHTLGGTPVTVTNSTVTNPVNMGVSSAMTMPSDQDIDVKATTNGGSLYGSRIVVGTSVNTASVGLTGTVTGSITEADIVAGSKTIILTLTGDTWVASGGTFDGQRQNIINGLTSAQSETFGWNNEVKAKLATSTVVRTSDTVVTIALSAQSAYDITATEIITVTVPGTALTGGNQLIATPTFTVSPVFAGNNNLLMIMGVGR